MDSDPLMGFDMERGCRYGRMGANMKDIGGMTKRMEKEDSFTQMETSTKDSEWKTKLTAKGTILI